MEFLALFLGKRDQRFREWKSMITFHFEAHKLGLFKIKLMSHFTVWSILSQETTKSHFNMFDFLKAIW